MKKRVLFIMKSLTFGGAERRMVGWLKMIDVNMVDIIVLTSSDTIPADIKGSIESVHFDSFSYSDIGSFSKWHSLFRKFSPHQVIFVKTWVLDFSLMTLLAAWIETKGHVFMTEHAEPPAGYENIKLFGIFPGYWKLKMAISSILIRRILTISREMKKRLVGYFHYPVQKIYIDYKIPDLIKFQPDRHRSTLRRTHGIKDNDIVIITVCRLERRMKRVDKALKVFADYLTKSKRKDIWYWIVGEGEDELPLKQLTRERGLEDRVIFWGNRNDVENYLKESDIFITTSQDEAWGNVLAEAICTGLRCMGTNTCGSREMLEVPNMLVGHSLEEIYLALETILTQGRAAINNLGLIGRTAFLAKFGSFDCARTIKEVFELPLKNTTDYV